jgi:hypothetical protein
LTIVGSETYGRPPWFASLGKFRRRLEGESAVTRQPKGAAKSRITGRTALPPDLADRQCRSRGTGPFRCSGLVDFFLGERPIAVDSERHAPAQSRSWRTTPQQPADPQVVTAA